MGITDKVSQLAGNVQQGVKNTSVSLLAITLRILTGLILGLTFALIGQEVFKYTTFMFVFMMVVVAGLIFRTSRSWSVGAILIFDLICVLVALLLRAYILIAP